MKEKNRLLFFFLLLIFFIVENIYSENNKHIKDIKYSLTFSVYFTHILKELNKEEILKNKDYFKVKLANAIVFHSLKNNISPFLIYNIIKIESNFNQYAISFKDAKGLMQLRDIAIKDLNEKLKDDYSIFSINKNIELGVKYFKKMLKLANGNIALALTFYNSGIGKVKNRLKRGYTFSKVVKNSYVKKIMERN